MTIDGFPIIKFCAEECERQGSGELSVYHMLNAWSKMEGMYDTCLTCEERNVVFPHDNNRPRLTLSIIEFIGTFVEPIDNAGGFRTIAVGINDPNFGWIEKVPWYRVPDLLDLLLQSYYDGSLEPTHSLAHDKEDQFYYEYENIHPFRDGNGRSGKIFYNYLRGTLDYPSMPPNFWGSSNP
jgi:hypothetical protein